MPMRIHADFDQPVLIDTAAMGWVASPMAGVERKMLDRIGDEVARATSLVRYAPGSHFSAHTHGGGEEFLVLEGVFSDEHGDYPAGTYVRNPIGTAHSPHSEPGCVIYVKLHQFDAGDRTQFACDTLDADYAPGPAPGITQLALHGFADEQVTMLRLAPGAVLDEPVPAGGEELLVLEGALDNGAQRLARGGWARSPAGMVRRWTAAGPALVWRKTGHLPPAA